MEQMDFPAAVEEIIAIQKKCNKLQQDAAEIAERTDKVSRFLCSLIGRGPDKTHSQDVGAKVDASPNGTWKEIIINDLKNSGKSYTSQILERICLQKNIVSKEEKKQTLNTIRTSLARFKKAGLIKISGTDGQKILWEAI
jgi:hypothetical protein